MYGDRFFGDVDDCDTMKLNIETTFLMMSSRCFNGDVMGGIPRKRCQDM